MFLGFLYISLPLPLYSLMQTLNHYLPMFPIHNLPNDSLLHNFDHNYMFLSLNCHVPHVRIVCMFINLAATISCICCFLLFNSYYTAYSSNPQLFEAVSFLLQLWKYCYGFYSNCMMPTVFLTMFFLLCMLLL